MIVPVSAKRKTDALKIILPSFFQAKLIDFMTAINKEIDDQFIISKVTVIFESDDEIIQDRYFKNFQNVLVRLYEEAGWKVEAYVKERNPKKFVMRLQ
ncbi:MAG: hypothetical protein WDK96_01705 [Candidatus Paceibacterota bacterium]|jgi:hypothetical protein